MIIVGTLLKQFGPTGSSGSPPNTPTLSISIANGVVTATITGSSVGATNNIYALGALDNDFVLVGSITGNGSAILSLDPTGRYFAHVISTLNSQSVTSNVVTFWLTEDSSGDNTDHSPADIVRWLLISQGKGTDPEDGLAWPIFTNNEHSTPDNCITTYDTSGILDGRIQSSGEMTEHFGFQIRVRSQSHNVGWRKINDLKTQIDQGIKLDTIVINSSSYLVESITRSGGILALGKESPTSQRLVFTLNAIVALRQLA